MKHILYFDYGYQSNNLDKIKLIRQVGFDGVFLFWDESLAEIVDNLSKADLIIETLHLPFDNCNELWIPGDAGDGYIDLMKRGILDAKKYHIPTVIFHVSSKQNPPAYNDLGLERFKGILAVAEACQVNIALENLRKLDYLDYLYENIDSDYLKFCFDSGHANAFTKNIEDFPWGKYQDKLICLHLHDNDGEDDLHNLPFEGNINWEKLMKKLKQINYQGPLTTEAIIKDYQIDELTSLKKIKSSLERLEKLYK